MYSTDCDLGKPDLMQCVHEPLYAFASAVTMCYAVTHAHKLQLADALINAAIKPVQLATNIASLTA